MASSRHKNQQSYADVDSDVDLDWEERQLKARRAAATKKKRPKTKKQQGSAPLQVFVNMPFDIFSEICSHLLPTDLLELSRSCRMFHGLLSSPAAVSIWSRRRRECTVHAIKYLDEKACARLLFSDECYGCEKKRGIDLLFGVQARLCPRCKKSLLISRHLVHSALPHLHPYTPKAALFTYNGTDQGDFPRMIAYQLRPQLEALSRKLYELQDEDELREFVRPAKRSRGTSTRPAAAIEPEQLSAVAKFVETRQAFVSKVDNDAEAIGNDLDIATLEEKLAWRDKLNAERAQKLERRRIVIEKCKEELLEHGWTDDALGLAGLQNAWSAIPIPDSSPSEDPAGWAKAKERWEEHLKDFRAAQNGTSEYHQQLERQEQLRDYHESLSAQQEEDSLADLTFPEYHHFLKLPHVRHLWSTKNSVVDVSTWSENLEGILGDIEAYRASTRITAIRCILSAQDDLPLHAVSKDPAAYPADVYNEAFFSRATSSFFFVERFQLFGREVTTFHSPSYPDALRLTSSTCLQAHHTARHQFVVRCMLEAAELDEETATPADLSEVGRRFQWMESKRERTWRKKWHWSPLLEAILKRMPAGEKPYVAPTLVIAEEEDPRGDSDDEWSGAE